MQRSTLGALAVVSAFLVASIFTDIRLSPGKNTVDHPTFGVSMLWAGHLGDEEYPLRLFNPTKRNVISSVLVYTAPRLDTPGNLDDFATITQAGPEEFMGCLNVRLTPHGAVRLSEDFFFDDLPPNDGTTIINPYATANFPRPAINPDGANEYMYVEIMTVSEQKLSANYRKMDTVGVAVSNHGGSENSTHLSPLHPVMWSLAEDSVVPGQRQDMIDCLCEAADDVGDRYLWLDWNILCPN